MNAVTKFHITKDGSVAECRATEKTCPLTNKLPNGLEQFHSDDWREVESHMMRQYSDMNMNGTVKKLPYKKKFTVTGDLIGDSSTDVERLEEPVLSNTFNEYISHTWLKDTEGRPMGFIRYMQIGKRLELCDVEVRPEFRGNGLGKRMIKAVEESLGNTMVHTGGYTDAGLRSIAPLFHSDDDVEELKNSSHTYNPMSFVLDWDRKYTKN